MNKLLLDKINDSELLREIINIDYGENLTKFIKEEEFSEIFFNDEVSNSKLKKSSYGWYIIPNLLELYEEYMRSEKISFEYTKNEYVLIVKNTNKINIYRVYKDGMLTEVEEGIEYIYDGYSSINSFLENIEIILENYKIIFGSEGRLELKEFYKSIKKMEKDLKNKDLKDKTKLERRMIELNITKEDFDGLIKIHNEEIGL